jgi:hypothetical protein
MPPVGHGPVAGGATASGVREGGMKAGGAARRGGHGARLPPAGWRLCQELRGLGRQHHPLHVPADATSGRVVLTFDCQMPTLKVCFFTPSPSVLSSHTSFDLDLFMECKIDPKLPYDAGYLQDIPWFLRSWSLQS